MYMLSIDKLIEYVLIRYSSIQFLKYNVCNLFNNTKPHSQLCKTATKLHSFVIGSEYFGICKS